MSHNGSERRKYPRVKTSGARAKCRTLDPRVWSRYQSLPEADISNISLGGMAIDAADNYDPEDLVAIDIRLKTVANLIKIFGRVKWIKNKNDGNYEIGVDFSWWSKETDKKELSELISQR